MFESLFSYSRPPIPVVVSRPDEKPERKVFLRRPTMFHFDLISKAASAEDVNADAFAIPVLTSILWCWKKPTKTILVFFPLWQRKSITTIALSWSKRSKTYSTKDEWNLMPKKSPIRRRIQIRNDVG